MFFSLNLSIAHLLFYEFILILSIFQLRQTHVYGLFPFVHSCGCNPYSVFSWFCFSYMWYISVPTVHTYHTQNDGETQVHLRIYFSSPPPFIGLRTSYPLLHCAFNNIIQILGLYCQRQCTFFCRISDFVALWAWH